MHAERGVRLRHHWGEVFGVWSQRSERTLPPMKSRATCPWLGRAFTLVGNRLWFGMEWDWSHRCLPPKTRYLFIPDVSWGTAQVHESVATQRPNSTVFTSYIRATILTLGCYNKFFIYSIETFSISLTVEFIQISIIAISLLSLLIIVYRRDLLSARLHI